MVFETHKSYVSTLPTQELGLQLWWEKGLFISKSLKTLQGNRIILRHPGQLNLGEGPDFFNAIIESEGLIMQGAVEIHIKASDWYRHKHQNHKLYQNLLLHVVWVWDLAFPPNAFPWVIELSTHPEKPTLIQLQRLGKSKNRALPCQAALPTISMAAKKQALEEHWKKRLNLKWSYFKDHPKLVKTDAHSLVYISIMRALGMPYNTEPMEWLAFELPYAEASKYFKSPNYLLLLYLGLCEYVPNISTSQAAFQFWAFQNRRDFHLPIPFKSGRNRRPTQPKAILSVAANLWNHFPEPGNSLLEASPNQAIKMLKQVKGLGKERAEALYINGLAPLIFGLKGIEALKDLTQWPTENNYFTRFWNGIGLPLQSITEGQASISLLKNACKHSLCLQCSIGQEALGLTAIDEPKLAETVLYPE